MEFVTFSDPLEPLECRVCSNLYNKTTRCPLILRCGHTYCAACLKSMAGKKSVECPECRRHHHTGQVSSITRNLHMVELIEHVGLLAPPQETAGTCSQHSDFPLYFYCLNHQLWICYMCKRQTHRTTQAGCSVLSYQEYLLYHRDKGSESINSAFCKYERVSVAMAKRKKQINTALDDHRKEIEHLQTRINALHESYAKMIGDRAVLHHQQIVGLHGRQQLLKANTRFLTNNFSDFSQAFKDFQFWEEVLQRWVTYYERNPDSSEQDMGINEPNLQPQYQVPGSIKRKGSPLYTKCIKRTRRQESNTEETHFDNAKEKFQECSSSVSSTAFNEILSLSPLSNTIPCNQTSKFADNSSVHMHNIDFNESDKLKDSDQLQHNDQVQDSDELHGSDNLRDSDQLKNNDQLQTSEQPLAKNIMHPEHYSLDFASKYNSLDTSNDKLAQIMVNEVVDNNDGRVLSLPTNPLKECDIYTTLQVLRRTIPWVFKYPGQVVVVPSSSWQKGRQCYAQLTEHKNNIHLHSLLQYSHHPSPSSLVLPYKQVRSLASDYGALVFLDLNWGSSRGRIYVRLNKHTESGLHFLQLCTGENGKTFAGTQFLEIYNKGSNGECVIGGLKSEMDQTLTSSIPNSSFFLGGPHAQPWIPGLVWGGWGPQYTQFGITLQHWPHGSAPPSCFGWIEKGLNILREAILHPKICEVIVVDCGIVIPTCSLTFSL